jgi:hypothetical protein
MQIWAKDGSVGGTERSRAFQGYLAEPPDGTDLQILWMDARIWDDQDHFA